jgi:serine/threonine protein kinase
MEHAQSGDLFDFSIKLKQPMGEALGRHIFKQIVDSVSYLHNQAKIVHRDLKLENIVLDKNFQVKLCDFAMSKTIAEGSLTGVYYSQVGSERYMAPEIIEGRAYKGASADVFALGVTLFALVTGVMPFDKRANKDSDVLYHLLYLNDDAAYWAHLNKVYDNESYFNKTLSDDFKKFITSFFKYNYYERVTIE